jgi:hypothetical protein
MMHTHYWTEEQDAVVRALWPDVKAISAATDRSVDAIKNRARALKLRVIAPAGPTEAQIQQEKAVLAVLTKAAGTAAPCPTSTELGEAAGVHRSTANKALNRLLRQGLIRVKRMSSHATIIEVVGVGRTAPTSIVKRKLTPPSPEDIPHAPNRGPIRTPDRDDIFAGVVFEDVPVRRDPRRAPMPTTHVSSRVEGAW